MERLKKYLTEEIYRVISENWDELIEIKIRINQPLILEHIHGEIIDKDIIINENIIKEIVDKVTNYSLYAYEREFREGYITVEGGHRIGFAGEGIIQGSNLYGMQNIRFLNIRICRQFRDYGEDLFGQLVENQRLKNTLILSPPGLGKTTMLRSIVKKCSEALPGTSIAVIDERNEISGAYEGIPQIDLGCRTDVISGMDKGDGILRVIRSMGPKIIAVDELGGKEDLAAIKWAVQSGISILATIHADHWEMAKKKIGDFLSEQFKVYIVISERGKYECFFDS